MSFSLSLLFYPYLLFIAVWVILSLVGFYHLLRFGIKGLGTLLLAVVYLAGALGLLQLSYDYLVAIPWETRVSILSPSVTMPSFEIPKY